MVATVILATGNPVRLSYLAAVLAGEGVEAEVQNMRTALWRLLVPAAQAEAGREVLRSLKAEQGDGP